MPDLSDIKHKLGLGDEGLAGLGHNIITAPIEELVKWARRRSLMPATFGLACCAIEMMATGTAHYDMARYGMETFRASPRQADLMIVAGTVTHKMAPRVKLLFEQMPEPKYVMAMGACTISGGPYIKHGYHVLKGVDRLIPVDVYLPGCPPRPEALLEGLFRIQEKMKFERLMDKDREGLRPAILSE